MKRKSPATRAQKTLLKSPRSALRRVTATEKLASRGRFSLGGEYLVPKAVKRITARTAVVTRTRYKDFVAGISHGAATALRKAGALPYKSAASEAQAGKQIAKKATPESKTARIRRAQRNERRRKAAEKAGIERGADHRRRVITFINEKFEQHERYLKTGHGRLNDDTYRRTVHLMFEYFGDDDRVARMQESYMLTAIAA